MSDDEIKDDDGLQDFSHIIPDDDMVGEDEDGLEDNNMHVVDDEESGEIE